MKNILFGLLIVAPTISYGNGIENKQIPFQMIYETVSNNSTYETLYNSDFVYYLKEQVPDLNFTIGNLFSSCVGYTKIDQNIDLELCKRFIKSVVYEQRRSITDLSKTFIATTTPNTTVFKFRIYAAGNYTVDCGDEKPVQKISKTDAKMYQEITCNYTKPGAYKIIIGGRATGYEYDNDYHFINAISFYENQNLAGIDGSLGAIFPTLGNGNQPVFSGTFSGCSNLTGTIPANLFSGISGAPAEYMFHYTFSGCSNLTGSIPENLFSGISGDPAKSMFFGTFTGCRNLTGPIPENLFSGIRGAPAEDMFWSTFNGCGGLTGTIPANLFSGIQGAPAAFMFAETFSGCGNLTGSIPENLFSGISGAPANGMFEGTFGSCRGLTGTIPEKLFSGIQGAPAENMFWGTFHSCSGLTGTIPEDLFSGIQGAPAEFMFWGTFAYCSGLSGIVGPSIFGKITPPITEKYVSEEKTFVDSGILFME